MKDALIFIVDAIARLYLLVMLLRFWLPWVRADFRNPIAQGILRATSPLVIPVRRVIPPIGPFDTATVIVAFALQYLTILIILAIIGTSAGIAPIALTSILDLVILSLQLFFFVIIIHIIVGWFAAGTYNPATAFLAMLAEPVLRPFRALIKPLGGFDITPIIPIILLQAGAIFVASLRPIGI